jgi:hypothetical protein
VIVLPALCGAGLGGSCDERRLGPMDALDFSEFTPTEFEEFCFELLRGLPGVHNVDWHKGTPKPASPADRGRDITAVTGSP